MKYSDLDDLYGILRDASENMLWHTIDIAIAELKSRDLTSSTNTYFKSGLK